MYIYQWFIGGSPDICWQILAIVGFQKPLTTHTFALSGNRLARPPQIARSLCAASMAVESSDTANSPSYSIWPITGEVFKLRCIRV